ncbi:MAG: DUF2070 family protein [Candidatus Micrarchaeia archaeon]
MSNEGNFTPSNNSIVRTIFYKTLPTTQIILVVLLIVSIISGIAITLVVNYGTSISINQTLVSGMLSGILALLLPAMLTILFVKIAARFIKSKYISFIAMISAISTAVFIFIGAIVFKFFDNIILANSIIIAGDAGIFALWFFISKILIGKKYEAIIFSIVQPTLNVLMYIFASRFIFLLEYTLKMLLIKLYAAIFIFLIIAYTLIYIFDKPIKKSTGFDGIGFFSQLMQNWIFGFSIYQSFGNARFGIQKDIETDTFVIKSYKSKKIKAVMFLPNIHYGPARGIGGSDFPYLLEGYSIRKYKAPIFVMHGAVNHDLNPVSINQINTLKKVLDLSISNALSKDGTQSIKFYEGKKGVSKAVKLEFGQNSLLTFTRAPKITEDLDPNILNSLKSLFESNNKTISVIDLHNSRFESSREKDLISDSSIGISANSSYAKEYIEAAAAAKKVLHKSDYLRVGVSSIDLYKRLEGNEDVARGNLNTVLFKFNGFSYALLQFNVNNMLPSYRSSILSYIKQKYNIEAEVCTTDTHAVNALDKSAENVFGRYTKLSQIKPIISEAIEAALKDVEPAKIYFSRETMSKFLVWGYDARGRLEAAFDSMIAIAKVLVPTVVIAGYVFVIWLISII